MPDVEAQSKVPWWRKWLDVPPVIIDGALYVGIAFFGALTAGFGTDEAAKYVEPEKLFWIRLVCGPMGASFLALKMFRSTGYAHHQQEKAEEKAEEAKSGNGKT